jgi:hypothetical protein
LIALFEAADSRIHLVLVTLNAESVKAIGAAHPDSLIRKTGRIRFRPLATSIRVDVPHNQPAQHSRGLAAARFDGDRVVESRIVLGAVASRPLDVPAAVIVVS